MYGGIGLDVAAVRALVDRIRAERGRLDVLVNDIWGGDALVTLQALDPIYVNFDVPQTPEDYVHRLGRAQRNDYAFSVRPRWDLASLPAV